LSNSNLQCVPNIQLFLKPTYHETKSNSIYFKFQISINYTHIGSITKFTSLNLQATKGRRKIQLYIVQTTIQTNTILSKSNIELKISKIHNLINKQNYNQIYSVRSGEIPSGKPIIRVGGDRSTDGGWQRLRRTRRRRSPA
jgi:hypothetical protein